MHIYKDICKGIEKIGIKKMPKPVAITWFQRTECFYSNSFTSATKAGIPLRNACLTFKSVYYLLCFAISLNICTDQSKTFINVVKNVNSR